MRDAPWTYWLDYVLYPAIVAACIAAGTLSLQWISIVLLGILIFTFAEYWVHRTLLHWFFYHGTHERHHKEPEEYVVFPIWMVPAFFLMLFIIFPLPLFTGFTIGYCWFFSWHHLLHHVDLTRRPLIARYAAWHLIHHKATRYNFGITVPFWDMAFGTYRRLT